MSMLQRVQWGVVAVAMALSGCQNTGDSAANDSHSVDAKVLGEVEWVRVQPADTVLLSRVDTGATSSSIDAQDIEYFERNGEKWVRYKLPEKDRKAWIAQESKLAKMKTVKRKGAKDERRPVVKMDLVVGPMHKSLDVNLANRSNFEFAFLLGRDFIGDFGVVDVTRKNVQGIPASE